MNNILDRARMIAEFYNLVCAFVVIVTVFFDQEIR